MNNSKPFKLTLIETVEMSKGHDVLKLRYFLYSFAVVLQNQELHRGSKRVVIEGKSSTLHFPKIIIDTHIQISVTVCFDRLFNFLFISRNVCLRCC